MLLRVVLLFLLFMAVIAWAGRARLGWLLPRATRRRLARHCRHCGAPLVGKGPCPCGRS